MTSKFRAINISEHTLITNQKVIVVELAEIEILHFTLASGEVPYSFKGKGNNFIIGEHTILANHIIALAQQEKIIEIDLEEFNQRDELFGGRAQTLFYHSSVMVYAEFQLLVLKQANGNISVHIEKDFSIGLVDKCFKDICIFLSIEQQNRQNYHLKKSGKLRIQVKKRSEELNERDKYLAREKLIPTLEVNITSEGFDFEEIKSVLEQFQDSLPYENFREQFAFSVDFKKLKVT